MSVAGEGSQTGSPLFVFSRLPVDMVVSVSISVGMIHVPAMRTVFVFMLTRMVVPVSVAVFMGVGMGMLMRVGGSVRMGMLVHVGMLVLMPVLVFMGSFMGMFMSDLILADITSAVLTHDLLLMIAGKINLSALIIILFIKEKSPVIK